MPSFKRMQFVPWQDQMIKPQSSAEGGHLSVCQINYLIRK